MQALFKEEPLSPTEPPKNAYLESLLGQISVPPRACNKTSTKITQDVRNYASTLNDKKRGVAQMSAKFKEMGDNVYLYAEKVKQSNQN